MSEWWQLYLLAAVAFFTSIAAHIRIDSIRNVPIYNPPVNYRTVDSFCVSDGPARKDQVAFASLRKPGNCSPYHGGGFIGQYASDAQEGSFVSVRLLVLEVK